MGLTRRGDQAYMLMVCAWRRSRGRKNLAAVREEQGRVLVVIPLRCTKQLVLADWLNSAQPVNIWSAAVNSCILHHGIVRRSLYASNPPNMLFEDCVPPLCLASCDLAQLSRASRAEDGHNAKATIEQHHRVRDKPSH
jgi:hypothetical protein